MADENILWRAQTYALLSTLLAQSPTQALLDDIAAIEVIEPDSSMGQQWLQLISAAQTAEPEKLQQEYQDLFIGITHGELMPYGCYYQTGFLMEEPLAVLRADLAKLGLERQENKAEPEDHVAAQCDVMRLILMAQEIPIISAAQFFQRHMSPWVATFFDDLQKAKNADFYSVLAHFSANFIRMETDLLR